MALRWEGSRILWQQYVSLIDKKRDNGEIIVKNCVMSFMENPYISRHGYRMKIKGYFFNCPFFSKLSQWIVVNWTITSGIPWTRSASSWLLSLGGSRPLTTSLRRSQLAILQLTKKCYLIGRTMKILYESKNWPKQINTVN